MPAMLSDTSKPSPLFEVSESELAQVCLRPLDYVQKAVEAHMQAGVDLDTCEHWGEQDFFERSVNAHKHKLSSLNHRSGRDCSGSLAVFRGIVRQPLEPELYIGTCRTAEQQVATGKYRDAVELTEALDLDLQQHRLLQRYRFVCASVPAQNEWVHRLSEPRHTFDPSEIGVDDRDKDGEDLQESEALHEIVIKFCNNVELQVGRAYEFVGVFERHSASSQPDTLHCVSHQTLEKMFPFESTSSLSPSSVRRELLSHLQDVLGGDELAAEMLLLHLISSVQKRSSSLLIGKMSLNLFGLSESDVVPATLQRLCAQLLCASTSMPLSLEFLHSMSSMRPVMNYDKGALEHGPLQLAPHTSLLIDETVMDEGALNSVALLNVKTLQRLSSDQILDYNYSYDVAVTVDVPVLVASTSTSILPVCIVDAVVVVGSHHEQVDYSLRLLQDQAVKPSPAVEECRLMQWRQFLLQARSLLLDIEDDVSEFLAAELSSGSRSENDMHRLLNLARLVGASHLDRKLDTAHWEATKRLDAAVQARNSTVA